MKFIKDCASELSNKVIMRLILVAYLVSLSSCAVNVLNKWGVSNCNITKVKSVKEVKGNYVGNMDANCDRTLRMAWFSVKKDKITNYLPVKNSKVGEMNNVDYSLGKAPKSFDSYEAVSLPILASPPVTSQYLAEPVFVLSSDWQGFVRSCDPTKNYCERLTLPPYFQVRNKLVRATAMPFYPGAYLIDGVVGTVLGSALIIYIVFGGDIRFMR